MPAWQRQWNDACQRLGVQPRQFAMLLAVLALGVGGLLIKSAFGPRAASASAAPIRKAPEATEPPAPVGKAETTAAPSAASKQEPGTSRRVVEMAFERTPSRDPFKPWNAPAPVTETAPAKALVRLDATPGVLPGLPLKAVVRGELAVFGDQTVRVGDAVGLPDGSFARIKAIGDRTVTVDHDGQMIDVQFGAGIAGKAPTAGGFR
jgi:hypothetical protein